MFESLYSSGLRLAELVSLDWRYARHDGYESQSWIQLDQHEATVRGKGGKTRSIPLGGKAIDATRQWLEVRQRLLGAAPNADSAAALFIGVQGRRISPRVVQKQLDLRSEKHTSELQSIMRHSYAVFCLKK